MAGHLESLLGGANPSKTISGALSQYKLLLLEDRNRKVSECRFYSIGTIAIISVVEFLIINSDD